MKLTHTNCTGIGKKYANDQFPPPTLLFFKKKFVYPKRIPVIYIYTM